MVIISNGKLLLILFIICLNVFFPFTNIFFFFNNESVTPNIHSLRPAPASPLPLSPRPTSRTSRFSSNDFLASSKTIYRYGDLLRMKPKISDQIQCDTVKKLVIRLLPDHHQWFEIRVNGQFVDENGFSERFRIETPMFNNGIDDSFQTKIRITGTSGVAVANGLLYYLKYITNSSISWSGNHISLIKGKPPPLVWEPIEQTIREKFRYYQNACTTSYSMVWWQWPRWQRELDWMALNGINLPLAFNGQELVFRRTFQRFNLTDQEINEYFTGPAYLAWNRMGNIQKWSGPLTEHWHRHQTQLQKKILKRMRQFGMYPIVPGFSGHVPRALKQKLPFAKINRLANWNHFGSNFSQTDFLEPEDPSFIEIGRVFIEEYRKLYGTDHFYNIDMFVEETPSSRNLLYLQKIGHGVYESIRQTDPRGIWVLSGYPFNSLYDKFWGHEQVKALISSVPINRMIILDVIAEVIPIYPQVDGYYGRPFIWCILHNYGGVSGMFGSLNRINHDGVFDARNRYVNMLGVGIAPEGIEQNDVVYDYMLEVPWHKQVPNMTRWFENYAIRRYGIEDQRLLDAWQHLRESVYHDPIGIKNHGRYIFVSRPRPNSHSMLWYDPCKVGQALKLFNSYINDNPKMIEHSVTFVHDLVDISRQTLQLIFDYYYYILDKAFQAKNLGRMQWAIPYLVNTLEMTESVLQSCQKCLLFNWINDARMLANDPNEQDYNEWQARTQISIWGPRANIANYAAKQWSGMFRHLYQPRWQLYFDEIVKVVQMNQTFAEQEFKWKIFNMIELPFTYLKLNQQLVDLVQKANTSKLISNVNEIVKEVEKTLDRQTSFKFYYNDTERWLE